MAQHIGASVVSEGKRVPAGLVVGTTAPVRSGSGVDVIHPNAMDALHGDPALARAASKLAATAIHVAHMVSESLPGTVRTHR
jgi:hypothetical protein